ncbi:MAG TPA: TRAP transporter small permease [Burkholderiales bacterium]|nr:TRAP transporter small permease [Burkholderiales bacterium]
MAERSLLDRTIDGVEMVAAGFLAVVTALTFVAVLLRYSIAWSVPDAYDFGRLLLGVIVFWGIAVASYRGDHITVDLLWNALGRRTKRAVDVFAAVVSMFCLTVFAWMVTYKVITVWHSHGTTMDLDLPTWPFYLTAWLGLALSVLLMMVRIARQLLRPENLPASHAVPMD